MTGQEEQELKRHTGHVNAVVFSHDGSLLASALDDRTVKLWNLNTGPEVQKLASHDSKCQGDFRDLPVERLSEYGICLQMMSIMYGADLSICPTQHTAK